MSSSLSQVVRTLMLPLEQSAHDDVVAALARFGENRGLDAEDLAIVVHEELDAWEHDGQASTLLRGAIDVALKFTPEVLHTVNATSYLRMHAALRVRSGDVAGLTHTVARDLLSRASLIGHLLGVEKFSCTQVARLLAATDARLDVSYGSIAVIARALGLLPKLPQGTDYAALWDQDRELSVVLFPDSSAEETNEIATEALQAWIRDLSMLGILTSLSRTNERNAEPAWPYLQILHWCLTPLEYFDHPASYLYEFGPRGASGNDLFANYPTATGNPVLNNAKAVETLNQTWSRNRGGEDAHALVTLLQALESLPPIPRREAARVLRAWLWRVIDLCTTEPTVLTINPTLDLIDAVTDFISKQETSTQGVIEQRVVDYLSYLAYGHATWRSRGLGDGVNASNFSRHKLGDVEFTNVDRRSAIAVEAHGGQLSLAYVRNHQRSLARIVKQRLDESWANLDDPSEWSIRVIFVAHSRAEGLPTFEVLHGVPVSYEYLDYDELVRVSYTEASTADKRDAFQLYVLDALNRRTVRETARRRFRDISSMHAAHLLT